MREIEKRFWAKVDKQSDEDCWNWTASKLKSGYGQFGIESNRTILAHRFSWILAFGDIPKGLYVCHHCDNPSCINPNHLFVGTQKDNLHDMIRKGRAQKPPSSKGFLNSNAKLSKKDVQEFIYYFRRGLATRKELCELFNIGRTTMYEIVNGKHWACQNR